METKTRMYQQLKILNVEIQHGHQQTARPTGYLLISMKFLSHDDSEFTSLQTLVNIEKVYFKMLQNHA